MKNSSSELSKKVYSVAKSDVKADYINPDGTYDWEKWEAYLKAESDSINDAVSGERKRRKAAKEKERRIRKEQARTIVDFVYYFLLVFAKLFPVGNTAMMVLKLLKIIRLFRRSN